LSAERRRLTRRIGLVWVTRRRRLPRPVGRSPTPRLPRSISSVVVSVASASSSLSSSSVSASSAGDSWLIPPSTCSEGIKVSGVSPPSGHHGGLLGVIRLSYTSTKYPPSCIRHSADRRITTPRFGESGAFGAGGVPFLSPGEIHRRRPPHCTHRVRHSLCRCGPSARLKPTEQGRSVPDTPKLSGRTAS